MKDRDRKAGRKDGYVCKTEKESILEDGQSSNACSAGDCTGLIPALPGSRAELEAYEELYRYLPVPPEKE
ncbi:MAG TPA: hypothetical protein IAB52_01240 [Candidatus Scatomonas merdavium]|nr:hypothetical protein [Candidatus Scatomonas merdavium]